MADATGGTGGSNEEGGGPTAAQIVAGAAVVVGIGKYVLRNNRRKAAEVAKANRRAADRVIDRQEMAPMRRVWDQSVTDLHRRLSAVIRDFTGVSVNPHKLAALQEAADGVLGNTRDRIQGTLIAAPEETATEAVRQLQKHMTKMGARSALDDEATVQNVMSLFRGEVDRHRRQTGAALAGRLNERVHAALVEAQIEDRDMAEVANKAAEAMDGEWYQVERAVRTEASYAYNRAQDAALKEAARDRAQLMRRWTELVDDLTGLPMDSRVYPDSMVLHGQLALPGGEFTMPRDPRAPPRMVGRSWAHPPNRPNDRAVITPWEPSWGIGGWLYEDGGKRKVEPTPAGRAGLSDF